MNKRQKKKKYKKICDKYNMPYSSYSKNRTNHTMTKRETRMINSLFINLVSIIRTFDKLGIKSGHNTFHPTDKVISMNGYKTMKLDSHPKFALSNDPIDFNLSNIQFPYIL